MFGLFLNDNIHNSFCWVSTINLLQGLNGAEKDVSSPSPIRPNNLAAAIVVDGLASPSSRPESSASSMNPSTSAAETEASESKTDNVRSNLKKKTKLVIIPQNINCFNGSILQEEEDRIKEDLGVLHPPGKKISKATTIASVCDFCGITFLQTILSSC